MSRKKDRQAIVNEVPKEEEGMARRDFLRKATMLGGVGAMGVLVGGMAGHSLASPGAGAGGTTITDEDIDAKRIAGVRIATEFITGTVPAGTPGDPFPGSAIQTAIDDLPAAGGVVYIPEGTWSVDAEEIIIPSDVYLIGAGFAAKLVANAGTYVANTGRMITVNGATGVLIKNLYLDGTGTDTCRGIWIGGDSEAMVDSCKVVNWQGTLSQRGRGITTSTSSPVSRVTISNCICLSNQIGIVLYQAQFTVSGCICNDNLYDGIYIDAADAQGSILGNICKDNLRAGIMAVSADRCTIGGNLIVGNNVGIEANSANRLVISYNVVEGSTGAAGIYLVTNSRYCTIIGNWVYDQQSQADSNGIYLFNGCTNNAILNNIVSLCNRSGIALYSNSDDNLIEANICFNNNADGIGAFDGIFVNGGDDITIIGNQCFDDDGTPTQTYGIAIGAGNSDCTTAYNDVRNNLTGGISDAGTTTKIRHNKGYVTENRGTAVILNGGNTVVVAHGLVTTPALVLPSGRNSDTNDIYVSARDATDITLVVTGTVGADRTVDWYAEV